MTPDAELALRLLTARPDRVQLYPLPALQAAHNLAVRRGGHVQLVASIRREFSRRRAGGFEGYTARRSNPSRGARIDFGFFSPRARPLGEYAPCAPSSPVWTRLPSELLSHDAYDREFRSAYFDAGCHTRKPTDVYPHLR